MKHIFLVDDEKDFVFINQIVLQRSGYRVSPYYDGTSALAALIEAAHWPDAIVLDIGMPRMDGYELCRQIRRQPQGASIPIIALTGYGQPADKQLSQTAGFDEHLLKPVDYRLLIATLNKHIGT